MDANHLTTSEFFNQVKGYFRYLFDEHDFAVASESADASADFAEIVLTSHNWRVSIEKEYGFVFVGVGPSARDQRGFYLSHIITFLDASPPGRAIGFSPSFDESLNYPDRINAQLRWWADVLSLYCDRIAELFTEKAYVVKGPELVAWSGLIEQEMRRELGRGFASV